MGGHEDIADNIVHLKGNNGWFILSITNIASKLNPNSYLSHSSLSY